MGNQTGQANLCLFGAVKERNSVPAEWRSAYTHKWVGNATMHTDIFRSGANLVVRALRVLGR